ncbi:hypothetical protein [Syntrophus sp. (in: bacteria)]|uniref:hypothetical protein n=1 Tax=Syntrophus sp. (in: bacteria) TaxID=48412 RepID=UPI00345E708B
MFHLKTRLPIVSLVDQILTARKADPKADISEWEAQVEERVRPRQALLRGAFRFPLSLKEQFPLSKHGVP